MAARGRVGPIRENYKGTDFRILQGRNFLNAKLFKTRMGCPRGDEFPVTGRVQVQNALPLA